MQTRIIPHSRISLRRQSSMLSVLRRLMRVLGIAPEGMLLRGTHVLISTARGPLYAVAQPEVKRGAQPSVVVYHDLLLLSKTQRERFQEDMLLGVQAGIFQG